MYSPTIESLIEQFAQLPGIGRKSAERIAFYILNNMSDADVSHMSDVLSLAKSSVKFCEICQNLTDTSPCPICASAKRDTSTICVVEESKDEDENDIVRVYRSLSRRMKHEFMAMVYEFENRQKLEGDKPNDQSSVV